MTTAGDVRNQLMSAEKILLKNFVTHTSYLDGDFWHIRVETAGLTRFETSDLLKHLTSLFKNRDVNASFMGNHINVGWFKSPAPQPWTPRICNLCYKWITKKTDIAATAEPVHVECLKSRFTIGICEKCGLRILDNQIYESKTTVPRTMTHAVCPIPDKESKS